MNQQVGSFLYSTVTMCPSAFLDGYTTHGLTRSWRTETVRWQSRWVLELYEVLVDRVGSLVNRNDRRRMANAVDQKRGEGISAWRGLTLNYALNTLILNVNNRTSLELGPWLWYTGIRLILP